jgi:alpha-L-rhamnosidase
MAPTTANPEGLTTIPENWDFGSSKNHMILLQIEEWFHGALAGIRQTPGSVGYRRLVIDPRIVGDLTHVEGSYETPYGEVASEWTLRNDTFRLRIKIPPNTTAEVRLPRGDRHQDAPHGADFRRFEGDRAVYGVTSGTYDFTVRGVHSAA